jgi:hypothetical protein
MFFISSLLGELKGNLLNNIQKVIIPIAHTSIAGLATLLELYIISGVIYLSVAAVFVSALTLVTMPAIPKSTILILFLAGESNRTFSNFRSRWITPFAWHIYIARAIYLTMLRVSISVRPPISCTNSDSSPPPAYSIIKFNSFR